jgi:hypothetical protein
MRACVDVWVCWGGLSIFLPFLMIESLLHDIDILYGAAIASFSSLS